jgi:acetolactate synthase-1/2/3 large subunit
MPGSCQIGDIVEHLNETLGDDAIIANGAGNYTGWVHRHTRFRGFPTQLAPTAGSMGYGLPAAIAAKLHYPHRQVICWAGDGCYLMHGQELATAVQYGANIIVLVVNNNMYGTIRMHQERNFPDRVIGTELRNPDFVALARSYGAFGARVTDSNDFAAVFEAATHSGKPALIELQVDPDACTPGKALHEFRS